MLVDLNEKEIASLQKILMMLKIKLKALKVEDDKLADLNSAMDILLYKIRQKYTPWHDGGKEHPHGEGKLCLVLFGVDESGKDSYDVLEWSDEKNAFKVWMEEYKDFRWFPADNFAKWLYLDDLL